MTEHTNRVNLVHTEYSGRTRTPRSPRTPRARTLRERQAVWAQKLRSVENECASELAFIRVRLSVPHPPDPLAILLLPLRIPRSLPHPPLPVKCTTFPGIRRPVRLLIRIPIRNCQSGLQSAVRATIRIVVRCIADTRERSRVTSSDLVRRIALPSFGAPQLTRHLGQGSAASIRLGFLSIKVFLIIFSLSFSDVFCA